MGNASALGSSAVMGLVNGKLGTAAGPGGVGFRGASRGAPNGVSSFPVLGSAGMEWVSALVFPLGLVGGSMLFWLAFAAVARHVPWWQRVIERFPEGRPPWPLHNNS